MPAYQYIYTMRDLGKAYPGRKKVFEGLHLSFLPNAKIGVLGANGSGKSTLLRIMAGLDDDYHGEAKPAEGATIGYLEQEPTLDATKTVLENVQEGLKDMFALRRQFDEVSARFADVADDDAINALIVEQQGLQEKIDACDGWDIERKVEIAMDALRCPDADTDVALLSGGERRRVALARLLLSRPDMLLLDEPTNHLDAESVWWLERFLEEYEGSVVAITHDRYFLDNVTGWILELDRGRAIPYEGNYSSWLQQKQVRLTQENREEAARRHAIDHELEWIRASAKGRQAKQKARISAFEELVENSAATRQPGITQINIPQPQRLGDRVIDVENLSKSFGDRLLIDNLSFRLPPGGIVGIIGPNGVGKTTLFNMLVGVEKPDCGSIRIGDTVKLGYVDQGRDAIDPSKTVWEEISDGQDEIDLGDRVIQSRAYVGAFNFKSADQQKKVGQLSGGERNRVHLAKMLKSRANLLLLDEPTNDLDVDTLRALEDALLNFPGCAVVISHDRWFLDRIATHIMAYEGGSRVEWFEGNFQEYEADKKHRLGTEASRPTRVKYKSAYR